MQKNLSQNEEINNRNGEKFNDEFELQSIDLNYDSIHS